MNSTNAYFPVNMLVHSFSQPGAFILPSSEFRQKQLEAMEVATNCGIRPPREMGCHGNLFDTLVIEIHKQLIFVWRKCIRALDCIEYLLGHHLSATFVPNCLYAW